MAKMRIRSPDGKTMRRLKRHAKQEGGSVNALVLRNLQSGDAAQKPKILQSFNDLDEFAGTWGKAEASAFSRDTAAFAAVDPLLWK